MRQTEECAVALDLTKSKNKEKKKIMKNGASSATVIQWNAGDAMDRAEHTVRTLRNANRELYQNKHHLFEM